MDKAHKITCLQYSETPAFDFDPDAPVLKYLMEHYPYFEVPAEGGFLTLEIITLEATFEDNPPPNEVRIAFQADIDLAKATGVSHIEYIRL